MQKKAPVFPTSSSLVDDAGKVTRLVRIFPYRKLSNGKYDLNQWSDDYWKRFSSGLRMCRDRDIIVQITLWDHFDFYREEWERVVQPLTILSCTSMYLARLINLLTASRSCSF